MKTKVLFLIMALALSCGGAQAQFLKKLGDAAAKAAEKAATRTTEQKVEKAVDTSIDKATDPNTYKGDKNANNSDSSQSDTGSNAGGDDNTSAGAPAGKPASAEMAYAKSDFVPGDEIIFSDDFANETMGEFPSQWDAGSGSVETVTVNGEKAIEILDNGWICPLMKEKKAYLPDVFTIEFDVYLRNDKLNRNNEFGGSWVNVGTNFYFNTANKGDGIFHIGLPSHTNRSLDKQDFTESMYYTWKTPDGESRSGNTQPVPLLWEDWYHVSISFNQRALKVYINGNRVVNIPTVVKPAWFTINAYTNSPKAYFYKNFRIAKGAVPLYDRMMTDGKIITYGITFDVGKSTLKPESMGEINRIATLMKDNPDLKFSVEGHTDSTGNAASNQTLSDARSKAVVDKLVSLGIAADRLASAGKGQSSPIADNGTDEGRAKNRRVEFVKIN
jgi:outer membrane protein OmpA-like peptidoglycan-associated protein